MYQALYRKWRPLTFSDVVGQEHITTTLKNQVKDNRIGHAYLFTGTRGTGKTSSAKIFARAVNCLSPVNGDPCNCCEVCKGILDNSIMDVIEMDAASNNGVDDIRMLREETAYTPSKTRKKVYIIDEVHMLSQGAFNALLKTLEEPPEHILFILATTEAHKLPATILSRCQRFDFKRISVGIIKTNLEKICQSENIEYENDALLLISRLGDGSMRDSQSILEQCSGVGKKLTMETVLSSTGSAGIEYTHPLALSVSKNDSGGCLEKINVLYSASKDMQRLCEEMINLFRDLLIVKTVNNPESILEYTSKETEELKTLSCEFSLERVLYSIDVLEESILKMQKSASKRLETEIVFLKLCDPKLSGTADAILARLSKLEAKIASGILPTAPTVKKEIKEVSEKLEAFDKKVDIKTAEVTEKASETQKAEFWPELLSGINKSGDKRLWSFLNTAQAKTDFDTLYILPQNSMLASIMDSAAIAAIAGIAKDITGKTYHVKISDGKDEKKKKSVSDKADEFLKLLSDNPDITIEE